MSAPAPREHARCLDAFATIDERFAQGVEKVILPCTGHFLPLERPQEVTQRIVAFMDRKSPFCAATRAGPRG